MFLLFCCYWHPWSDFRVRHVTVSYKLCYYFYYVYEGHLRTARNMLMPLILQLGRDYAKWGDSPSSRMPALKLHWCWWGKVIKYMHIITRVTVTYIHNHVQGGKHSKQMFENIHRVKKNCAKLFLPELRQISTNFDNFLTERWQRG